jgi:hypothetical protein
MTRTILASAIALLALGATAGAAELAPASARSVQLGSLQGIAYYTAEADGFRVVATLAPTGAPLPVRFEATLADGQRVVLSTPRAAGYAPYAVEIARRGETVVVTPRAEIVEVASAVAAD